jgi:hypothetical protein
MVFSIYSKAKPGQYAALPAGVSTIAIITAVGTRKGSTSTHWRAATSFAIINPFCLSF